MADWLGLSVYQIDLTDLPAGTPVRVTVLPRSIQGNQSFSLVVSSDGHAGLHAADYRPYVEEKYRDAFDAALPG